MHQCGPDHLHIVSLDPGTLFDHYTEYGYTLNGKYPWTLESLIHPTPLNIQWGQKEDLVLYCNTEYTRMGKNN